MSTYPRLILLQIKLSISAHSSVNGECAICPDYRLVGEKYRNVVNRIPAPAVGRHFRGLPTQDVDFESRNSLSGVDARVEEVVKRRAKYAVSRLNCVSVSGECRGRDPGARCPGYSTQIQIKVSERSSFRLPDLISRSGSH